MPDHLPAPGPQDIDAIAERVADSVTERIVREHPDSTPEFRKQLVRLYVAQEVGSELPPGEITSLALGRYLGIAPQRMSEISAAALARVWKAYHDRFPDLF